MRPLKTARRPPIYPKTPGHLPCSSLTHPLPLPSRRPSVSFGGFGLTLSMAAIIVVLMALTTALDIRSERERARASLQQRGLALSDTLSNAVSDAIYFGDIDQLGDVKDVVMSQPDIEYFRVIRTDGGLLEDSGQPGRYPVGVGGGIGLTAVQRRDTVTRFVGDTLEVASPVSAGREVVGGIEIGFSTRSLDQQIGALTAKRVWQGVALLAIGVLISYGAAQYLVRPVRRLARAARRISEGEYEFTPEGARGDEIGDLSRAFEEMTRALRSSRDRLEARAGELGRANEQLETEIAEREETQLELRRSRQRIVAVAESVRRETARHLHGSVQNKLILLLHRIDDILDHTSSPDLLKELKDLRQQVETVAEQDVRRVSQQLYPAILRRGLSPALQSLGDRFEAAIPVEMEIDQDLAVREKTESGLIPEQVRLAAYRVAEEALTNVLKHAEATTVALMVSYNGGSVLTLSVRNDGRGFDIDRATNGVGIGTMRDYAEVVSGVCDVSSSTASGTQVKATFPLDGRTADSRDLNSAIATRL